MNFFLFDKQNDIFYPIGTEDGSVLDRNEYYERISYHNIVSEKNGFVGNSTRSNIIQQSSQKYFPYTNSTHTSYPISPSQTVLLNMSIDSLASRHPNHKGFFMRFYVDVGGETQIFQTSTYDDAWLMCDEINSLLQEMSAKYADVKLTKLVLVIRS